MRADNFDSTEMESALRTAYAYGVKTYITLNTRLFDDELHSALCLAAKLYEDGATALIVADAGLARLIKKYVPELEIHASTQLSGHNAADARALCDMGFSRMVCHREASLDELRLLCAESPIEIEMFIHGAYCVSFSGQCLMSAVMGGRSGNRGECAQPCRQPYALGGRGAVKGSYPISLRDMCLAGHITDILKSGVASLKIEGRQKPAEYVYGVTRIYRRLLDEERNAADDEIDALRRIFSRGGFSAGYFEENGRNMRGVRTYEDYLEMDKTTFRGLERKVPLDALLRVRDGEHAILEAVTPYKTVTAKSEKPCDSASVSPLSGEGAEKNAGRLGATPFYLRSFRYDCDSAAPLTLSQLNALRREATEKLCGCKRNSVEIPSSPVICTACGNRNRGEGTDDIKFTAEFLYPDRVSAAAREFFDRIYIPYGTAGAEEFDVSLPPYISGKEFEKIFADPSLSRKGILCHTAGQLKAALERGFEAAASLRMNIFNSAAAETCEGTRFITAAPEVRLAKIRDMRTDIPIAAVVYGRLPLMLCLRCAVSDGGEKCPRERQGLARTGYVFGVKAPCVSSLTDRRGTTFPIVGMPDCSNVIYNSVPTYMADRTDRLRRSGVAIMHFVFTDETGDEADGIINAYKNGRPPVSDCRRMQ